MSTVTVTFIPETTPISDYKVENVYQQVIHGTKEITICNYLLLTRFRVGVVEGDFKKLIVKTIDDEGKAYEEATTNGLFCKLWHIKIFGLSIETTMRII